MKQIKRNFFGRWESDFKFLGYGWMTINEESYPYGIRTSEDMHQQKTKNWKLKATKVYVHSIKFLDKDI